MSVNQTCGTCKGSHVWVGAKAVWNVPDMQWVIEEVYVTSEAWCDDCEAETQLVAVETPKDKETEI